MKTFSRQVIPDVYNVGVIDWSVKQFHGYETANGTSYNSYLIMDYQPTLIDSVKAHFFEEQISRIRQLTSLDSVKYLVLNHAEPDHTSALPFILPYFYQITLVCNAKCKDMLLRLYPQLRQAEFLVVDARTQLNIGRRTLRFLPQTMLHWPESMWTYSPLDNAIFTNDAFGQHIAACELFADELPLTRVLHLLREYLANILGPFPGPVQKAVQAFHETPNVRFLLTAHGLSWRDTHIAEALEVYRKFAENAFHQRKILVLYDTVYGQTYKAARIFADGVIAAGHYAAVRNASVVAFADLGLQAAECSGICVATPTVNNYCMPRITACLSYLRGLGVLKGKPAFCIIGGGWNFKALQEVVLQLEMCRCEVYLKQGLTFKFRVTESEEEKIYSAGSDICYRYIEV